MPRLVHQVAAAIAVAAVLASPAAHAAFSFPSQGRIVDSVSGLEWAQGTSNQALLAEGFRYATMSEAQGLVTHSGLVGQIDWSYVGSYPPGSGATASNGLGALSFLGCGSTATSPQVCQSVSVLGDGSGGPGAASPLVLNLVRSAQTTGSGPLPPNDQWRVEIKGANLVTGANSTFQSIAQAADGNWFTVIGTTIVGFDPVTQSVIRKPLLDKPVPYLMVRAVPEPQSWLLMGLGLAGIVAVRRRAQG